MVGRRDSVTESRVLQWRDARSIRVLIPDCRGLDQNFHDVTVVDMGDLPESHVSMPELSELAHKWRICARRRKCNTERNSRRLPCEFCGTNQVRYVSACGTLPLGFGSVVAVPSVLVYRLEGHATGLNGPCSRNPQCAGGGPERFSRHGQLHARCTQTR